MVRKVKVKGRQGPYRVGRSLRAQVRADDLDGDPLVYRFIFGDGTAQVTDKKRLRHTYSEAGRYRVTVIAYDGELIDRQSVVIKVKRAKKR